MTLNAHDNIVLVAPRPVRLAAPSPTAPYPHFHTAIQRPRAKTPLSNFRLVSAPADAFDRLKLGEDVAEDEVQVPDAYDRASVSPRASPRSNLPSEALEEFFSIFNSSSIIFPPTQTSPIMRASNPTAGHAQAFFAYRRSPLSSLSPTLPSEGLGLTFADHADETRMDGEAVAYPFKILASHAFGSPVSRVQTRNPFQHHPSYDSAVVLRTASASPSPCAVTSVLSPAAVPLPLPTPDETMEIEMGS